MQILLIGAGQLGSEIAHQCQQALPEASISLMKRRRSALPYQQFYVDVTDRAALEAFSLQKRRYQHVVYCLSPDKRTSNAYEQVFIQGLQGVLQYIEFEKFWFISSTAVYPQADGGWVTEQSPCHPTQFNGQVLRQAEQLIADQAAHFCILRLSGIYGAQRTRMLDLVQTGVMPEKDSWSNRIHQLDAARALAYLLTKAQTHPLYNVTDSQPTLLSDVVTYLRQQLNVKKHAPWPRPLSIGKKVSNQRLLDTGFKYQYANYQQGYGHMLQSTPNS